MDGGPSADGAGGAAAVSREVGAGGFTLLAGPGAGVDGGPSAGGAGGAAAVRAADDGLLFLFGLRCACDGLVTEAASPASLSARASISWSWSAV